MGRHLFSGVKWQIARKEYPCSFCLEPIKRGEKYGKYQPLRNIDDLEAGKLYRFHPNCWWGEEAS